MSGSYPTLDPGDRDRPAEGEQERVLKKSHEHELRCSTRFGDRYQMDAKQDLDSDVLG